MPSFEECGVNSDIIRALARTGIAEPFPIQAATLPDAISGRDILGRGQTGSGKTLAFGLAMLTRLAHRKAGRGQPLGLVLVPTRELAMQVNDALAPLAHTVGLDIRLIAGGMPYNRQIDALRRGVPILVATPGRLMDLVEKGEVDLSEVSITVLDEADQMADLGFLPIVKEILDLTRAKGQRLLFSATLDRGVDALVKSYLRNAVEHSTSPTTASVNTMDHHVLLVHPLDKDEVTAQIAARSGRTILFVRTQAGADRLAEKLALQGVPVGALHGGKSQAVRTRTLSAFKDGITMALVATDVAARGIHVDDVSLVVHVDAPTDPKDYLHRAGRTARAGESGTVVTLVNPRHQRQVVQLTQRAGVAPEFIRVRPNSPELMSLTGAQVPTGIPWITPRAMVERPSRGRGGFSGPRRSGGRDETRPSTFKGRSDDSRGRSSEAGRTAGAPWSSDRPRAGAGARSGAGSRPGSSRPGVSRSGSSRPGGAPRSR
jgi:superfamily II DNA/RNA helicase